MSAEDRLNRDSCHVFSSVKGLCKENKIPKIRDYYGRGGGGWVQVSLRIFFFFENHPKIALNQYRYFRVVYHICILYVYTLIKVVSYYI